MLPETAFRREAKAQVEEVAEGVAAGGREASPNP